MKLIFLFVFHRFPAEGFLLHANLHDQGQEILTSYPDSTPETRVPVLGLLQTQNLDSHYEPKNSIDEGEDPKHKQTKTPGRIAVFGDSNCIDESHMKKRKC